MTRIKDFSIDFSGIIHDHNSVSLNSEAPEEDEDSCLTIAILRRHPMYDCLVLVKRFRSCLDGYALEFPMTKPGEENHDKPEEQQQQDAAGTKCRGQRLVSRFLDGDDLIYQSQQDEGCQDGPLAHPFSAKVGDIGGDDEIVHVPINGLLDRLKSYTASGIAVDSRVYSFAFGLKTSERLLTTSFEKELQETPKI